MGIISDRKEAALHDLKRRALTTRQAVQQQAAKRQPPPYRRLPRRRSWPEATPSATKPSVEPETSEPSVENSAALEESEESFQHRGPGDQDKSSFAEFYVQWRRTAARHPARQNQLLQEVHLSLLLQGFTLQTAFEAFDQSGEGQLDLAALQEGISSLAIEGLQQDGLTCAFELMDSDGDGYINVNDWHARFAQADDALQEEHIAWLQEILLLHFPSAGDAFHALDTDGDGLITANELTTALQALDPSVTPEDMARIMWSMEMDINEHIESAFSFEFFVRKLQPPQPQHY